MKRILLTMAICVSAALAYGQGAVNVNTWTSGSYIKYSNTVASAWATGSNVVTWALYYGSSAGSLQMLPGEIGADGFSPSGAFIGAITGSTGGGRKVTPDAAGPAGTFLYFQIRAWSVGFSSYEDAIQHGTSATLVSDLSVAPIAYTNIASLVGSPSPPLPTTIQFTPGRTSSTFLIVPLIPIPEPGIVALTGLGLLGLLCIRRRK